MPIYLGNTEIGKDYVDSYELGRIYLGSALVNGGNTFIQATGGTITSDGDYKIPSFTNIGNNTFTINSLSDSNYNTIEYLIVGGGGSGGWGDDNSNWAGGGGGAGGVLTGSVIPTSATSWTLNIGNGGSINTASPGTEITASSSTLSGSFSGSFLQAGGGGGGELRVTPNFYDQTGASGGGGDGQGSGLPGQGTSPGGLTTGIGIGNVGGSGSRKDLATNAGGGGGAGSIGGNATNNSTGSAGNGGDGLLYSITGTATYYAAGGGGGSLSGISGSGGLGGGGNGGFGTGSISGTNATGYGSGGGGARRYGSPGSGSSGIIVLRYKYK